MSATEIGAVVIALVVGVALGAAIASAQSNRRSSRQRVELARLEAQNAALEQRVATEGSALEARFEQLSSRLITEGGDRLADLAAKRFEQAANELKGDLDLRDERLKGQVAPIATLLTQYKEQLTQIEVARTGAYEGLLAQVEQLNGTGETLRLETQSLVTALRAPQQRGRWGEIQLRRVVEMAGMVEHCDFIEQVTTDGDDGPARPDMVVMMPGGRTIVVDAKVPLAALLDDLATSHDAPSPEVRAEHARQLRAHVDSLSKKAYWNQFAESPDFVVCFVPGEGLLAAAFEADPGLVERALESRVLLASPVTLVALLRTISFGWREEAMAENARQVQELGQELYTRLSTLASHLGRMGRSLTSTVDAYDGLVGAIEGRVLVSARRFRDLGAVGDGVEPIAPTEPISQSARRLAAPELVADADIDD